MKINPISVDKLKHYDWFYSDHHNLWYYYKKREKSGFNFSELDDTLDPIIKKIVTFINGLGYKTLPSCSGHNRSKVFIDKAWKNLLEDSKKIRTSGLWLSNCENKNKYFLLDRNWKLPFTYDEFRKICSGDVEVIGYIGFECKDKMIYKLLSDIFDNNTYIDVKYDNGVIEIFNKTKDDGVRSKNWKDIDRVLRDVLKK